VPRMAIMAAVVVFAASVALYCDFIVTNYSQLWSHTDEWVYRAAGLLAQQHPAALYRTLMGEPGKEQLPFTYPPFAALVFGAFSWLSFSVWQLGLEILGVILLPVSVFLALRISGHRGWRPAAFATGLAAICLWMEPVYWTLYYGQINLVLLALVLLDFSLPDSCRWKGVATGIAAAIKLTPLIFTPYLLASLRVRAGITSLVTFAASVLLGFAVLPAASAQFWTSMSAQGAGGTQKMVEQSLNGVIQRMFHLNPPADTVWMATALVVGTVGVAVAAQASRRGLELLGVVLCGVTGLLVSPVSWTHHWVWCVPALALLTAGHARSDRGGADRGDADRGDADRLGPDRLGPERPGPVLRRDRLLRAGGTALLLAVFFGWPEHALRSGGRSAWFPEGFLRRVPHGQVGPHAWLEYTWRGATWVLGNSYVLAGLLAIAGSAAYLWATRTLSRPQPDRKLTDPSLDVVRASLPAQHGSLDTIR
jgi:alpha-1,2-mannosyltransferase